MSSEASRPASGFDVMLILESVTPPFVTLPFAIGFPVAYGQIVYVDTRMVYGRAQTYAIKDDKAFSYIVAEHERQGNRGKRYLRFERIHDSV